MRTLILLAALFGATAAHSTVVFTIERYSDTLGVLSGTGTIDRAFVRNAQNLALDAPLTADPTYPYDKTFVYNIERNPSVGGGEMLVGTEDIDFAFAAGAAVNYTGTGANSIYFGDSDAISYLEGAISGSIVLDLRWVGATFAPIGSSGTVFNGAACSSCGTVVEVGTWEMIAGLGNPPEVSGPPLPLPPTLVLLISGFASIAVLNARGRGPVPCVWPVKNRDG